MKQYPKTADNIHLCFTPVHLSGYWFIKQGYSQVPISHPDYIEEKSKGYRIAGQQLLKDQGNTRKRNPLATHKNIMKLVVRSECKVQK